jgi:hypothetical protein
MTSPGRSTDSMFCAAAGEQPSRHSSSDTTHLTAMKRAVDVHGVIGPED